MSESNINVAVKLRPLIKREIEKKIPACWRASGNTLVDTLTGTNEFNFDLIFDESSTTSELYDKVARPIVSNALAGVNGTVFAYGQTSSGKTHTMMGNEENDGLMLMAIKQIFNEVESSNIEFVLRVGFIEIYNERVFDLYDADNVDLKMVEKNNDAYVNCKEAICKCVEDMYNVIKIGNKNKKIGDTDMNDRSSRSHTIFRISIESIDAASEKGKISNLNLVDLAGSERASQTNATGARFVEGSHINKSLLALSKVVNKLINNEMCHINYRDSKLTRYLQSSLGGNALAAIICTICPTTLDETISTLYFAQRAMKVTNKPRVNEIISDATTIKQLHNQIKSLQVELEKARNGTESAVPRILRELSFHQGNIINYRKAENRAAILRRRTWTTFDNELPSISEAGLLVTEPHKNSLSNLRSDAVTPIFKMVTADRGSGEDPFDAEKEREDMSEEFEYKSKYEKLLMEYEELQEFTDWEKKLNIEPDAEAAFNERIAELEKENKELREKGSCDPDVEASYKSHIEALELEVDELRKRHAGLAEEAEETLRKEVNSLQKQIKQLQVQLSAAEQEKASVEYSFELHQKKAEKREVELVNMMEELKNGSFVNSAVEEKNNCISELQQKIAQLTATNNELAMKSTQHEDVEQRLVKMAQVEVELEELKNTITVLTNTILTLENEKKEMSIRFNESITGMAIESSMMTMSTSSAPVLSTPSVVVQSSQTEVVVETNSKLQADYDELSNKVMDLIEENEELKQRALELEERLNDNCDTQDEELSMIRSEREAVENQLRVMEVELREKASELLVVTENAEELRNRLKDVEVELQNSQETVRLAEEKLQNLEKEMANGESQMAEELAKRQEENLQLETLRSQIEEKEKELAEMEEIRKMKLDLETDVKLLTEDRDDLKNQLETNVAKLAEVTAEMEKLTAELEKNVQEIHSISLERDCLANDLKNKVELIGELEKNVESGQSKLSMDLMEAQMEKARLTTEVENKIAELQQLKEEKEESTQKFTTQVTRLEETRADVQEEVNRLTEELQLAKENMETEIAEKAKQLDEAKAALDEEMAKSKSLEEKIAEAQTENQMEKCTFEKEIEMLKLDVQEKSSRLGEMENLVKSSAENTNASFVELQNERDRLNTALDMELQKVHSLGQEVTALKFTLAEMESVAQEKESSVEELQREVDEKLQKINDLESQLDTLPALEREVDDLKQSQDTLQTNLEEQLEKVHAINMEKQELRLQLEEKSEELKRLQQESLEVAQKTRQRNSLSLELQEKINELESQLAVFKGDIQNRDSKIEECLSKLKEAESQMENKTHELSSARTALQLMTEKVKQIELSLEESANQNEAHLEELEASRAKLLEEMAALSAERGVFEQRANAMAKQLREMEEEKRELSDKLRVANEEKDQLKRRLESATTKRADIEEKHQIVRNRVAELEAAGSNSAKAHEEEVAKLHAQIRKMRSEMGSGGGGSSSGGAKERRARRSSLFDNNRDLFSSRSVETMTEPTSETCQCPALDEKIQQMKKQLLLKDMQMVQMRAAERESPMLLENYNLKQMVKKMKDAEARQVKDVERLEQKLYQALKQCKYYESKTTQSVQCQTMPDMNSEVLKDLKHQLSLLKTKYEEAKEIVQRQKIRVLELETEVDKFNREAMVKTLETNENQDPNPNRNPQLPPAEDVANLRRKYELVKKLVEQRYVRIRQMQVDMANLERRRTCVRCSIQLGQAQIAPNP